MTRTLATCAAAALLLALSACSSDPEPRFDEPSPSSQEPSIDSPPDPPEESGAPPVSDSAMRASKVGAIAFVRDFWSVANYSQATGDTRHFRQLMSAGCEGCIGAVKFIEEAYADGGTVTGGEYTISNIEAKLLSTVESNGKDLLAEVTFEANNTRQTVTDSEGKKTVYGAGTSQANFILMYEDDAWKVSVWNV